MCQPSAHRAVAAAAQERFEQRRLEGERELLTLRRQSEEYSRRVRALEQVCLLSLDDA